jgi:hypothetical protein
MNQTPERELTPRDNTQTTANVAAWTPLVLGLSIVICTTGVTVYSIRATGSTDALDGITRLVHALGGSSPRSTRAVTGRA